MLSHRFDEALLYASHIHAAQTRKGTSTPYISHLLGVCSLVLEHGGDEDEAIAALLHDAIEDQGGDTQRQCLRARFGERVAATVDGCTDAETEPKPPWRGRKEAYIKHLAEADASVRLISCADKLHNARAIAADYAVLGEELWSRFNAGRETLWYYRALADQFQNVDRDDDPSGLKALVKELAREVEQLENDAD